MGAADDEDGLVNENRVYNFVRNSLLYHSGKNSYCPLVIRRKENLLGKAQRKCLMEIVTSELAFPTTQSFVYF